MLTLNVLSTVWYVNERVVVGKSQLKFIGKVFF